jgi:hypothetical protein
MGIRLAAGDLYGYQQEGETGRTEKPENRFYLMQND